MNLLIGIRGKEGRTLQIATSNFAMASIWKGNVMAPHASYRGFPNTTPWLLASTSTYAIGVHITSINSPAGCLNRLQKHQVLRLTKARSTHRRVHWSKSSTTSPSVFKGP